MTIIGSAHVQIRADDKYFESDVRKAAAKIKNVNIQLKADVDLTKASKKIRDLRYRITNKDAVLKVDANVTKAEEKMARLLAKFLKNDVEFNAVANTRAAESKLADLKSRYAANRVTVTANADTKAANAQLAAAARNRRATISADIDPQTRAALAGLYNVLTGTISADKIKSAITGLAANFEGLAVKATTATTAILALSGALLTTGANLLSIAGDITQVIGLTALIPTAIGSMVSTIVAGKMAWKDFATAMSSDAKKSAEAMKKLPPQAQAAAKALKGVYTEIQRPVQKAFWESMNTSLQDTVKTLLPSLKDGLSDVGRSLGSVTREVLLAFGRMGDGSLLNMLQNLGKGLENMAPGFGALIDSFGILGEVGSTYLPRFGEWTTELATRFRSFIEEAEKTGKINQWIDTGIQRLKEMGSIVKSTAGIFSGLTQAARLAGAPGLTEMAESLRNIRDIVNGEPFQTRLVTILEGARTGVEKLNKGFSSLTKFIGESADSLALFLDEAGEIAGLTFENIRALFDGTGLGNGLFEAMQGLEDLMRDMKPGFKDLGDALGSLGRIAGEVIRNLGPGLNQLFETLRMALEKLEEGVIDVIPVFNEFIQALLHLVQGPIVALADGIGNILKAFAGLPDPIQNIIMSLGLFAVLAPKFLGFWDTLGKKMSDQDTRFGRSMSTIRDGFATAGRGVTGFQSVTDRAGYAVRATADGMGKAFARTFDSLPPKAQAAVSGVKNAFKDFGAGFGAGLNLSREFDTVNSGLSNVASRTRDTFKGMRETIKDNFSRLGDSIAPAGGAIRTWASGVSADLAPARAAVSSLAAHTATSMKNMASQIGGGLKTAASGLVGALGGGWGIALAGATVALGAFAQAQADTEAKIKNLSGALDEQTAAWNEGAKKMFAEELLDLNANWWDDLARSGRRNMEELVRDTDMNIKEVIDILSDPKGRDAYVENWRKIRDAAGDGAEVNEELASSVNMTTEQLKSLKDQDLRNLVAQFEKAAELARKAEQRTLALAKATGTNTVEAAALARNYDTLRSSTSSLDEKFNAFRQNLDITTGGFKVLKDAGRDFADSMFSMEDNIEGLGEKYGGLIEGTKKLSKSFKDSLFNTDGTFSKASREAVEFSKQMDVARDAVLKAGITEFQKLRDAGVALPEAQAKALAAMEPQLQTMRNGLAKVGFDTEEINKIMGQLGLDPDKLRGALELDTADAEGKAARFEIMMAALKSGNWTIVLAAQTDEVKNQLLSVEKYREAYANGGWTAVVKLIDEAGPGIDEFLLKLSEAKGDKSKIKAILEAEAPGAKIIQGATQDLKNYNNTNPVKKALEAQDKVTVPAGIARKGIEEFNQLTPFDKYLKAQDKTAPAVEAAKGTMGTLPDVERDLLAKDSTLAQTLAAQGTMNTLSDVERRLLSLDRTAAGRDAAQGTMNSLKDVSRGLHADNFAESGRSAAQGTIDRLTGKSVNLEAKDNASTVVNNLQNKTISDKSFTITAAFAGLSAAARAMFGLAHGGIISGNGAQTFANGGFSGIKTPAIKAFANGGTENHVAQIARGAWPVRVWAEPETGGEAYVPLHPNKRKRSLKILEEVATMFGYSLTKAVKFADGGFFSASQAPARLSVSSSSSYSNSAPSSTSSAGVGHTTIFNQTINPSQGLNEKQIAKASATELFWLLDKK